MPTEDFTGLVKYWQAEIKLYEREFQNWEQRGQNVVKRYIDERSLTNGTENLNGARFNILWSNTETILPAIYARVPKPDVSRRYKDNDPVGRVAALLIERCLEFENEQYGDFHVANLYCLLDRLLPGRGVAWVRYEPTFVEVTVPGQPNDSGQISEDVTEERLQHECTPIDYVHWRDFGHSSARRWEEVRGVWRLVHLTKKQVEERFGQAAEQFGYSLSHIVYDHDPQNLKDKGISESEAKENRRAQIYEIWDKDEKKAIWLTADMDVPLDVRDDPLKLERFFPCPRPLLATTSTDSLVPVPDYCMYQDQARELDTVTQRIAKLQEAVKVVGVYDATQDGVKRMLNEGVNNTLIPVDTWSMFAEKGGIKGVVDFLPLDQVINALERLYEAREQIKQVIYEVTGIADILRGSTDPNETLGAQQIKANYAGLRIRKLQSEQAEFARDLLRMRAQVICNLYSDQTILKMAGAEILSQQDQQLIPQALQLIRNSVLREFRIDIETDSMVQVDEQAEKEARAEFLTSISQFMEKTLPMAVQLPTLAPMIVEMMKFGIGGFKVSKSIEGALDAALEALKNLPPQNQPDPAIQQAEKDKVQAEVIKAKAGVQTASINAQSEQTKAQATAVKAQADMMGARRDMVIAQNPQALQ